jgi:hypothetical protein
MCIDVSTTQKCNACLQEKPLSEFYFRKDTGKYKQQCKRCCIDGKNKFRSDTHKVCKHCGEEKPFSEYQKAGGGKWLQPYCKPCDAERKRKHTEVNRAVIAERRQEYFLKNKEVIYAKTKEKYHKDKKPFQERGKLWREKNIDKIRERSRKYHHENAAEISKKWKEKRRANPEYYKEKARILRESRTPEQIESKRQYDREYKQKNKEILAQKREAKRDQIREYKRIYSNKKAATDFLYRLKRNLRTRIRCALKPNNRFKADTSERLLGCTIAEFKVHIESLFTEGMSWERFMAGDIHVDHIKPCALFDLTKEEEQRACFNYKNCQPLWKWDNLKKGANYQPVPENESDRQHTGTIRRQDKAA